MIKAFLNPLDATDARQLGYMGIAETLVNTQTGIFTFPIIISYNYFVF